MPQPFLSIVIPAYNESLRIGNTLEQVRKYSESKNFPTEIILVDDGSTDSTPEVLTNFCQRFAGAKALRNEPNKGKGYSVKRGILEAQGEFILFTDADL